MEGAHVADNVDKKIVPMATAWDPHVLLGTLLALIAILILLTSFGAGLPRELRIMTGGFFVAMLVQYILPFLNDSAGGRVIAAFHAVNALIVTGLAIGLAIRARPYLPVAAWRGRATQDIATSIR